MHTFLSGGPVTKQIQVIVIPGEVANMMWEQFKDHLELAMIQSPTDTAENMEALRTDIRNNKAMLMQIWDGCELVATAVLEFTEYRDGKSLHIRYLGGEGFTVWRDELHERVEEMARAHDCKWISLSGRAGWKRELAGLGFNPVAIELRAEVANGAG